VAGAVSGSSSLVKVAEVLTQAHVLGFGILVVLVILVLPNGSWATGRKSASGCSGSAPGPEEEGMAYFQVDHLVKYFGGLAAVNGVTFEVAKGEIFGLIGPTAPGRRRPST